MSDMKRRVIYMSDQMWATVRRQAQLADLSASDWIRGMVAEDQLARQERAKRPEVALAQDVAEATLYRTPRALEPAHIPAFTPAPKPSQKAKR